MRKAVVLIQILTSMFLFLFSAVAQNTASEHLFELKSKYPYGLLGDDYGVLTIKDLALNACRIKPELFVFGTLNPYEYWLCFDSKTIIAFCEDQNFSNEDGHIGRVKVKAQDHKGIYQFMAGRPWPIQDCKNFVKTLKHIILGTSHACISASHINKEEKSKSEQTEYIGIFHRLKTKKGCEGEECMFTEQIRKKSCPDLKP